MPSFGPKRTLFWAGLVAGVVTTATWLASSALAVGGRTPAAAEPAPSPQPAASRPNVPANGAAATDGYDFQPITQQHLLHGTDDPAYWLMYGGNYAGWRFSPLDDVNRDNVENLTAAWMFQTGIPAQLQASPIVADGIIYLTAAYNHVFALDAVTGALLWRYEHPLPDDLRMCCGPSNKGAAIAGDKIFMSTLDAKVVALDRKTGAVVWETVMDRYTDGFSATAAPLVVRDNLIVGIAGGEYGIRGYIDAYDVDTGARKWRRYTIPEAGEPGSETWSGDSWKHGGAPTWVTGSYDPESDLLYWATGNTAPDWNGDVRKGDNLYADSVLALNPDTGEMQWYFQFTPHDIWDYDGNTDLFLLTVKRSGEQVKALAQPNRNGYVYVLDRASGRYLHGTQYVDHLNWSKGLDEAGRPIVDPKFVPTAEGKEFICPGSVGGKNGSYTAAYSPRTKLMYVPVIESCWQMKKSTSIFIKGIPFWGGGPGKTQGDDGSSYGHLSAIDPSTGQIAWRYRDEYPMMGGALATAGGVVFTGNLEGYALAFDDTSGELLWKFQTGSSLRGQPVTYKAGGRQYVAIPSGGGGLAVTLVGEPPLTSKGSALLVFALPE